jgi:hypothetical protein
MKTDTFRVVLAILVVGIILINFDGLGIGRESRTTPSECGTDQACLNCVNKAPVCWLSQTDNRWYVRGYGYANSVCALDTYKQTCSNGCSNGQCGGSSSGGGSTTSCSDTDGGEITGIKGTLSYTCEGQTDTFTDYCSGGKLLEFSCNNVDSASCLAGAIEVNCGTGYTCSDGACVGGCGSGGCGGFYDTEGCYDGSNICYGQDCHGDRWLIRDNQPINLIEDCTSNLCEASQGGSGSICIHPEITCTLNSITYEQYDTILSCQGNDLVQKQCQATGWVETRRTNCEACAANQCISADQNCVSDQYRCNREGYYKFCPGSTGYYGSEIACPTGTSCNPNVISSALAGLCVSNPTCGSGTYLCTDGLYFKSCVDSHYGTATHCPTGTTCTAGTTSNVNPCKVGTGTLLTCEDIGGVWSTTSCSAGKDITTTVTLTPTEKEGQNCCLSSSNPSQGTGTKTSLTIDELNLLAFKSDAQKRTIFKNARCNYDEECANQTGYAVGCYNFDMFMQLKGVQLKQSDFKPWWDTFLDDSLSELGFNVQGVCVAVSEKTSMDFCSWTASIPIPPLLGDQCSTVYAAAMLAFIALILLLRK